MTLKMSALRAVFRKNNLLSEYEEQEPVFVWSQVAGEVGKIARPKEVRGDSLILEVPSAAAKQELSYLEDQFLEKLNEALENKKIQKLKFQLGRFPLRERASEEDLDLEEVSLSEEEKDRIDNAVSETGLNPQTRESLKRLLVTQKKKRKVRIENGWNECPSCGGVYPGGKCPYCGSVVPSS
ncbi:MAG: DciA family protein [Candidatus Acetothermia bacterium]